ncbi:MAG TPA: hypothetical protein VH394_09625 [Thermoanaerobaculia bacterium]|jgi:hypothetical protein|nr:hypothetical protein [Thermoanaerobaculia bacterium]
MRKLGTILTIGLLSGLPLSAQHHHPEPPPETPPPAEEKPQEHGEHAGHAGMEGMKHEDMEGMDMAGHEMPGMLGPYKMSREASGTAWQPESAPHTGLHTMRGDWHLMAHGFLDLVYDDQDGPRGDEKLFSESMLMGMAVRPVGTGRLGLRAMVSAEPWTVGDEGYPLLLQTGETADGRTPLVDRQHPHDLFMELAGTYSHDLGPDSSVFVYLGLPGEPALGPPAYLHRFSGMENPEAPLGHHWLDSTHITFGVATLGWVQGGFKLEGSAFKGREPDEDRTDIEDPKLDSWAVRASWQPAPDWSFQVSRGHLNSPEQLEAGIDKDRTTASAIYNRPLGDGNWQTTFAWGRNESDPGETTDSFLLESAATLATRHTLFGRAERQENDELFGHGNEEEDEEDHHGEVFTVGKISLGYVYDVLLRDAWKTGVGSLVSLALIPSELEDEYGETPVSWMVFLRTRM